MATSHTFNERIRDSLVRVLLDGLAAATGFFIDAHTVVTTRYFTEYGVLTLSRATCRWPI